MKYADKNLIGSVFKGCFWLVAIIAACRFSGGAATLILAILAVFAAISGRVAYALGSYALFAFMVIMSSYVLPKTGVTGLVLRLAPIGITLGLLVQCGKRAGNNSLPVGMLWVYLFVACLSSATGYNPTISYLKLVNFAFVFAGIHLGLRNIDRSPQEIEKVRMFVLSLIVFMVVGSLCTLPFPGIAYSTSVSSLVEAEGLEAAADVVRNTASSGGMLLFAGLTNQSQALGIIVPCALGWLLCDMLFVERRKTTVHTVSICSCFPLLYMCRSRTALVAGAVAVFMVCGYCLHRVRLPPRVRVAMKKAVNIGLVVLIGVCVFMEVRNNSITKFLRKHAGDDENVSLSESFTQTRMGKVEENMADFKVNPLLGTGFQVVHAMQGMRGFRLSAPIEKSVLPTMVLGETGIVGGIVFFVFLCTFYGTCIRKKYFCTMTMMSTFLATNLSEATFFSPGGVGGVMWIFCGVGGFVNDMIILNRQKMESSGMPLQGGAW